MRVKDLETLKKRGSKILIRERYCAGDADNIVGDDSDLAYYEGDYLLSCTPSRRGQEYCLICDSETLELFIFATTPDGSGGIANVPSILFDMIAAGEIVE